MSKGKGRAGKRVQGQRKGKVSINKRARIDTETESKDKGLESDDGGESVEEKLESSSVSDSVESVGSRSKEWRKVSIRITPQINKYLPLFN
jgi:hypothetical protein